MIIEKITRDRIAAMKAKDIEKSSLLAIIISEIKNVGKNDGNRETTDEEAIKVIKKFVKSANETVEIGLKNNRDISKSMAELEVLNSYLPKQMTKEELTKVISSIIENSSEQPSKKMVGVIMKKLKTDFAGLYDGKEANLIVNGMINC